MAENEISIDKYTMTRVICDLLLMSFLLIDSLFDNYIYFYMYIFRSSITINAFDKKDQCKSLRQKYFRPLN